MNQEQRNLRWLLSLILLILITVYAFWLLRDKDRVIVNPEMFKVADLTKVDGVVLESAHGKISLRYDSNTWKINNRFEADHQMITVLFATLEQAIPKRPVAVNLRDSVNARLDTNGTTVSLYEGTELVKTFRVGGDSRKNEAWFRNSENKSSYVMNIPGYRVYVSQIFELDENGWRDKRIFDFRWRNFVALTSDFPTDRAAGFRIAMINKVFTIEGVTDADTARVNTYLDDISLLRADQILSPGTSRSYDSLLKTTPVNRIEVIDIAGRRFVLNLYAPLHGESIVLGLARDRDMVTFDREKIFRMVKKRAWFRLKDR
jgi:hypothetical protein